MTARSCYASGELVGTSFFPSSSRRGGSRRRGGEYSKTPPRPLHKGRLRDNLLIVAATPASKRRGRSPATTSSRRLFTAYFRPRECGSITHHPLQCRAVKFIRQFITSPITTGAIAPSSSFLAREMVDGLDLSHAAAVLEYGPGTGVFTDYILRDLNPAAKFAAIELNSHFAAVFRMRHPGAALFEDSVEN